MWRSKSSLYLLIITALLLFSAFAVNAMWAQDDDPAKPTPVPSETPLPTDTPTYTETPTATPTATYTATYTETPIPPTATYTPSATATAIPTEVPTSTPTAIPPTETLVPSATPQPTEAPTQEVTAPPGDDVSPTPTLLASATVDPIVNPTATATIIATAIVPLTVTQAEPSTITAGQASLVSIIGTGFTANTTVRLMGYGFLTTNFINSTSLTASVPAIVPVGGYVIQVSDPVTGSALAPTGLTIVVAPVTPTATAVVSATPKPTDIPGEPELVVRNFSASPDTIYPSDTTQITFEVVNVGSRTAEGVVVSLGDGSFLPADGQASVSLPNLATGAVSVVTLSVIAPSDAKEGAASVPLVLSSRDFSGTTYSDKASVSVTITEKPTLISQVVLEGFTVTPTAALPGESVNVQAVITNTGNATASQVLIQLDSANSMLIAGAQGSSFAVGELKAKASKTIVMPLIVANGATAGIQAQTFTITYLQDGESKQAAASISLQVNQKETLVAQVIMNDYTVSPTSALPGDAVSVKAVLTNTGSQTAKQVTIQLNDTNAILIAGTQGSTFTVGDLQPNASTTVIMPLVVANDAKAGVQAQSFTVTYLQDSDQKQATGSISLQINPVIESSPVLLLQSYSTGDQGADSALQPGQQFTYQMTIQNAGTQNVSNLLVTFGTVKSDTSTSASTSSSTTASSSFATIGSGDTVYVGDLTAGKQADVSQAFIVNSDVTSGIYNLPITLQYTAADGTTQQQSMNANLVVVVQPRLRVSQTTELASQLTARQSYTLSLKIANLGSIDAALTKMKVSGTNVTVTEGAETLLETLSSGDDTTETAKITPQAAGDYTVTVEVEYIDALNRTQTYTTTLTGTVTQATRPTPVAPTTTETTTQGKNLIERLLLGFLGLGG